jgi:predicted metal-dependent hydrolase
MQMLDFKITRSKKRRKTIAIRVHPEYGVEVKVPHMTPHQHILTLLETRLTWIQKKMSTLSSLKKNIQPWYERDRIFYLGIAYTLVIEDFPFAKKRATCELQNERMLLTIAQGLNLEAQQQLILKSLEAWYRQQATTLLTERTHYFAQKLKVHPKSIIIKTQKSRWGSCDRYNNIRYNWKIIMAPLVLVDYLVVHELAHIHVKNHSKKFWKLVAEILPDHQLRRKQLKEFFREIF